MTTATTDLQAGATAALRVIETGPDAVNCTRCHATPGEPCTDVAPGRHHQERLWQTRLTVIATLRTALGMPLIDGLTPGGRQP